MIKRLHHACISVSDMDRSLAFYRDILGLKVMDDFEISGEEWDELMQSPKWRSRIVYFEEHVELTQVLSTSDGKPVNARPWDHGAIFLIFQVTDVDKMYSSLVNKGVEFYAPPRLPSAEVATVGAMKVTHLRGPDGERISLLEWPEA